MSSPPASLQVLARTLRLSRTTICDALSGKGRVAPATVERVRRAAKEIGYQTNPLVSTVLGSLKRASGARYRGALAVIDLYERGHWPHGPFPCELVVGAKARAAELGFSITSFVVGSEVLPLPRLDGILRSRGIHGIIVLPAWQQPDLLQIDWSRYAGIYTDEVTAAPQLHSVCPDHYGSMLALLSLLEQRGYRRPGLVLSRGRDERIRFRQRAAYLASQTAVPGRRMVPPLISVDVPDFATEFSPWYMTHQPDVVLSHVVDTPQWIARCTRRNRAGFVLLNVLDRVAPCAALDLQPRVLGARAVELAVAQILRGEFGVSESPTRSMVAARWVEGPTVRPPP